MTFQRQEDGSRHWIIILTLTACVHMSQLSSADIFGPLNVNMGIKISSMNIQNAAVTYNDTGMTIRNSHNATVTVNEQVIVISNTHSVAITVNDDGITVSSRSKCSSSNDTGNKQENREDSPIKEIKGKENIVAVKKNEVAEKEKNVLLDKKKEEAGKEQKVLAADKEQVEAELEKKVLVGNRREQVENENKVLVNKKREEAEEEKKVVAGKKKEEDEKKVEVVYQNHGTIHYEIRNNKDDLTIGKYINYGDIHVNLRDNKGSIKVRIHNGDENAQVFIHCHRNRGFITVVKAKQGITNLQTNSDNGGRVFQQNWSVYHKPRFTGKTIERKYYGTQYYSNDNGQVSHIVHTGTLQEQLLSLIDEVSYWLKTL